ncbi:hypothetical protein evm_015163, partial [Chilo suppressalis]
MPRRAKHSPNVIYDKIKVLCFVDDSNNLLPYGHPVWQEAADLFKGEMQKDYIYLYLKQNRNGVFGRLHGETIESSTVDKSADITKDNAHHDENWSMEKIECALPPLRVQISVSKSDWDKISSLIVEYEGREYEVLASGWSDVVYDILWSELKLPCPYAFKNAKINRNPGEVFLTIKGNCSECHAIINIYCVTKPTADGATFYISTFDSRGIVHDKKRQLRGDRRQRIGKELQGKSTYAWRRDEAKKLMTFGDVIPANLPSEEVARKAKQETRDKELGLYKVQSVLDSLRNMKYGLEFNGCIHEIGLDKFYVMYWHPTQMFLYKKFLKEDDFASISVDATGSLIKQIPKPDGSKNIVYLYQAVCGFRKKILPLFQMISEKHDTNTLTYWIREWLRSGGSSPKQVVTDYSLALLNATCLAFNDMSLKSYVENCIIMDTKTLSTRINPPRCLIRIDIAHLIKLVTRWSCFHHESPEKKDFYLRCIGLLTMCTGIDDCVHIDESLLEIFDDFDQEVEIGSNGAIDRILRKIEVNSQSVMSEGRLNPYYCANFGSKLLKLAKHFVLWTAVMIGDDFQYVTLAELTDKKRPQLVSTSARSEEYFRELKHLIFKKEKSIRADKFLVIHLRSLTGTSNLLNAPEKKSKKSTKQSKHSTPRAVAEVVEQANDNLVTDCETLKEASKEYELQIRNEQKPSCPNSETWKTDDTSIQNSHISRENITDEIDTADLTVNFTDCTSIKLEDNEDSTEVNELSRNDVPSTTKFLNETEDWRGLTKITVPVETTAFGPAFTRKNKRGKFVTVCPDVMILHKRPKFCRSLPLLVNGSFLGPAEINKKSINVRNTCAFDSTVQSLLAAYYDFAPYYQYITESHNVPLNEFVKKISNMGISAKLYDDRGEILKYTNKIKNGELDCMINIGTLMGNFILRDVPSVTVNVQCRDCKFENSNINPVLDVDPIPIARNGLRGLQQCIENFCTRFETRTQSECKRCNSTNVDKTVFGGRHLLIDIETLGIKLLTQISGVSNCRTQFTLLEIPEKLNLYDHEYKLVSAIIFVNKHYYAYIKRATVDEVSTVLVNVSPISRYHSLFCPALNSCLPQIATEQDLNLVIKLMLITSDRAFRIGFNSLCALASVNHLHYHLFVEKQILPVENAECIHLIGPVFCLYNYPVPSFCFQVRQEDCTLNIAGDVTKLLQYFLTNDIAHNIFMTKGRKLNGGTEEIVRILVWPRKSSAGAKQLEAFNVAVCELSGWFPVY